MQKSHPILLFGILSSMKAEQAGYADPQAVANYIEERERFGWRARGERAVRFAEIKNGNAVLDLCCGPGMVTKVIRETVGVQGRVVGIDSSPDFITYARTFCNEDNVSFIAGNVEDLPAHIGNQEFDAALLLASWLWINNKDLVCAHVRNCLTPEGKFVISLSSDNLDDAETNKFYWAYRDKLKESVLRVSPSTDISYFNKLPVMDARFTDGVISQLHDHGFSLQSRHEVERVLSLEDKLFTYNNPARTEWVGSFPPDVRLGIIRQALHNTGAEVGGSGVIKRHTHYLVFGLG